MKVFAVVVLVSALMAAASGQGTQPRRRNAINSNNVMPTTTPTPAQTSENFSVCYSGVETLCENLKSNTMEERTCSAITSHFEHLEGHLAKFANLHLEISYKYLLLAAQFDSYVKDRPGFQAKFQALSDRSWAAGQELIQYITKRGAQFVFANQNELKAGLADLNEFQAMATVLDTEKYLFEKARLTHKGYSHSDKHAHYDPEAAHYIEEDYLGKLAASVREYSGYANDLKNLYKGSNDIHMDNYLFDQYLQKA